MGLLGAQVFNMETLTARLQGAAMLKADSSLKQPGRGQGRLGFRYWVVASIKLPRKNHCKHLHSWRAAFPSTPPSPTNHEGWPYAWNKNEKELKQSLEFCTHSLEVWWLLPNSQVSGHQPVCFNFPTIPCGSCLPFPQALPKLLISWNIYSALNSKHPALEI